MGNRERVREFKEAPWGTPQELTAFLERAVDVGPDDREQMLTAFASKASLSEQRKHRARAYALNALIARSPSPLLFRRT